MSTIHRTTRRRNAPPFWSFVVLCLMGSIACGGETSSSKRNEEGAGGSAGALSTARATDDAGTPGTAGTAGNDIGGSGGQDVQSGGSAGEDGLVDACATVEIAVPGKRQLIELVVEASDSMRQPMPGSTMSRWDYVRDSLEQFISDLNYTVRLGLTVFPSANQCSGLGAHVEPAMITEEHKTTLIAALRGVEPGGGEPLDEAFRQALVDIAEPTSGEVARTFIILDDMPAATTTCPNLDLMGDFTNACRAASTSSRRVLTTIIGLVPTDRLEESAAGDALVDCSQPEPTPCEAGSTSMMSLADRLFAEWQQDFGLSGRMYSCEFDVPPPPEGRSYNQSEYVVYLEVSGVAQTPIRCSGMDWIDEDKWTARFCMDACGPVIVPTFEDKVATIALQCL